MGGGVAVLGLYWSIYKNIFERTSKRALSRDSTWGYLKDFKNAWYPITIVTTASVLTTFYWITLGDDYSARDFRVFAFPGTLIFMSGAIAWPIGVLTGKLHVAQLAVVATAVGSAQLLAYVILTTTVAWVWVAAIIMLCHHALIDGMWIFYESLIGVVKCRA